MATFIARKEVASLPGTLSASTLYFVRTGVGFDIYLTNESGTIVAYPLNSSGSSNDNIDGGTPSSTPTIGIDGGTP